MSSDPLAQADIWAGAPNDTDYEAVYAAVAATERGRWFLAEYASRNRHADTQLLTNALARIEAAVLGDAPAQATNGATSAAVTAADAMSVAAAVACEAEPAAAPPDESIPAQTPVQTAGDLSAADLFTMELAENRKFAEAVAALASSLTMLAEKGDQTVAMFAEPDQPAATLAEINQPASEPQSRPAITIIPPPDYTETAAPPPANARPAPAPHWYIEAPDFVFGPAERRVEEAEVESPAEVVPAPSPPSKPQLPPDPEEDPADLFESATDDAAIVQTPVPAAAAPQLKIAKGPAAWPAPRLSLSDPLAGMRSLSEEELIALFG
jgi:hypothetical protein